VILVDEMILWTYVSPEVVPGLRVAQGVFGRDIRHLDLALLLLEVDL